MLALPRGGVPVGAAVARKIGAPLDVLVVRKVGSPQNPELGVGAVAEGGGLVLHDRTLAALGLTAADVEGTIERERAEVARRCRDYRGERSLPDLAGRDAVLVDDGLATGVTAEAAVRALRLLHAGRVILATPVCAPDTADRLAGQVDELVCLDRPRHFGAVGSFYEDFRQTTDQEVVDLLAAHASS